MAKSKLDWALETQRLGLPVFPVVWTLEDGSCSCGEPHCLKPGKHPMAGSRGFKDATLDPEEARAMWDQNPQANIAAYPGEKYVVIDLDCKRLPSGQTIVGLSNLANHLQLEECELLDRTYTVETPSGGYHLYFLADQPYSSGVGLITGVDSRAVGGYVLAPGSVINDKPYSISSPSTIKPIPEEFSRFLKKIREKAEDSHKPLFELDHPAAIERVRQLLKERSPAIEGKGGNSHTYVTVCIVKDHAISAEKCLALLMEKGGWNERCEPPWDARELSAVIENAYEYGKDRPGSKGGSLLDMFNDSQDISSIDSFDDYRDRIGDANDPFAKFRANWHNATEFKALDLEYDMIAPGWIPASGFTCFLALRSVGKTTVLMDLCCRLANDMDWQGVELDKGWTICWIVGEDEAGAKVRLQGWEEKWGREVDPDRFLLLKMPIDLNNAAEVDLFARFVRQEMNNRKRVIYVLDTWQRMTSTAESQSKDSDMQLAVHHVEALARSFGGPAFIAFHPPKANPNTIMGSSIIENSSQAIIQITDEGNGVRQAAVTRIKGEGYGNYLKFKFEKVEIEGVDRFGKPKTSVVAVRMGGTGMEDAPEMKERDIALARVVVDLVNHIKDVDPNLSKDVSITDAAKIITSIPQHKDNEALYRKWYNILAEAEWRFEPEKIGIRDWSKTVPGRCISRLLEGATRDRPVPIDEWGLYVEKQGNKSIIRVRKTEYDDGGMPDTISGIDGPVNIEEPQDA